MRVNRTLIKKPDGFDAIEGRTRMDLFAALQRRHPIHVMKHATEPGTRMSSTAKPHRQQPSAVTTNTTLIAPQPTYTTDTFRPLPRAPVRLNPTSERKSSISWTFGGLGGDPLTSAEAHRDIGQMTEEQKKASVRL
ncbi:hypothetical protein TWF506_003022 [Arthrobotrys conoides]|uniref:Uncharacterized protein n=1 Tax=Arthrobotrys conoides TaxID=74498 RepID=A0AAN8NC39_9PEZI